MTSKEWDHFFYCETSILLNILVLACMYPLRVSRGPHDLCLRPSLVNLSKALGELGQEIEMNF